MAEQPAAQPTQDTDRTLLRIRNVAAIVALATTTVAVVALVVLMVSLYPSLRRTVQNLETASASAVQIAGEFSEVSESAAKDLSGAAGNINEASVNFRAASENLKDNSLDDTLAETIVQMLAGESGEAAR